MSAESMMQVVQHILALELARLYHRQDPLHKATARLARAAETPPAPQYRQTQQTLHKVIRWFDAFGLYERPERSLQPQHVLAKGRDGFVVAENGAFEQHPVQPIHHGGQLCFELYPRGLSVLERMPRGKDLFDDLAPLQAHEGTWAAAVHDLLEIPFQVGPANLASLRRHLVVDPPTVAAQNALDFRAQNGRHPQGAASGMDDEYRRGRRRCGPQPAQLTLPFPTGLVGGFHRGGTHRLDGVLMRRCQGRTHFLFEVAHRAQRDRRLEQILGDFLNAALADPVSARKIRQGGSQARLDAMGQDLTRNRGPRDLTATRADTCLPLIFGDHGHDLRQFNGLKACWGRVVRARCRGKFGVAMIALARHERHDGFDAVWTEQLLQMRRGPRVTAAFAV